MRRGRSPARAVRPDRPASSDGGDLWSCGGESETLAERGFRRLSVWCQSTSEVAALIIATHGGSLHPDQVRTILQQSADPVGKRPHHGDRESMERRRR